MLPEPVGHEAHPDWLRQAASAFANQMRTMIKSHELTFLSTFYAPDVVRSAFTATISSPNPPCGRKQLFFPVSAGSQQRHREVNHMPKDTQAVSRRAEI